MRNLARVAELASTDTATVLAVERALLAESLERGAAKALADMVERNRLREARIQGRVTTNWRTPRFPEI